MTDDRELFKYLLLKTVLEHYTEYFSRPYFQLLSSGECWLLHKTAPFISSQALKLTFSEKAWNTFDFGIKLTLIIQLGMSKIAQMAQKTNFKTQRNICFLYSW